MRTKTPRLTPLRDEELDAEQEAIVAPFRAVGAAHGVARTFARNPAALTAFRVWATYDRVTNGRATF
jgi:4-carboxymuconolactone decarboxylase